MRCPACGEENPERAKFCLECGSALAEAEPRQSRESRRTVTVVFADMVGFTSLGESLDQESLRRVMDRFYAEMRGAIEAQDGTLAKFIGDAVLAVWGTPEVREDDALRAVRAADAMRLALAGLNEDLHARWGVRVGMRTGVNTGEVVVDPDRPADLLVGDTLNVAARLEQAAGDGEVLVGPETYRLVRDDTVLEPVEPLALKGKAKPIPAWRVVDTLRDDRRGSDRLQAPLVGREAEVAALRAALDTVVATRSCRMTTVIGSPGLGKTRLVDEFAASVGDEAIVLYGRCQATGEGITFQPVAEVLRGAAGIEDDDGPDEARAKLGTVLPGSEPDRDRVIERAASLLGLAPAGSTEETFWAVRRILEGLSRKRPVVLVHDDIHWGQPTFLDLLEHFLAWIRDAPVFVLALARPELREVRPGLAEESELIGVIPLQPLDAAASRAMVSGLLGAADLPEGLALRVLETTEGNPLFLGETLRMLADEGVLLREGDTWVAGDLSGVTVPPTINALLAARIQRLDADERSVVERAAVIGHAFYRGAVSELSPAPARPQVDGALQTLTRKEMVRPEDEWWLDEQVFRFHHVLIRDAAYRSLLKEARAELHQRFAGWLEAKAGELAGEHEEVIAFHLEQAHAYQLELGPLDERGRDLAARAGRRLHSAGCRALAREDLPAATNLLRRALFPLTEDGALRMEVLVDLAETLVSAGDTGAAEEVVEELGLGADELGDHRLRARAVVFAAQLDNLTGAGQVRETADVAAAAAETLASAGDRAGEAKAHQVVAQSEALLGQVAAAEAALDRALVAARAADDRRRITAVLSGAPRAALWGPAPIVRASGRCLDVVRILRMTPGNRHVEAAALRSQAVLEAMRGRAEAARGILDTCRVTLEELGLLLELHETAVHAGIVELLAGDAAAAETHLRAAQEGFHALGIESGAAQAAALLARALLAQDHDEEALEATRFAERHGGEDLKTTATWLAVRAEVLARAGSPDEARELARRAVALTEPTDALADKADALMALASVEALAGDEQAAQHAAARAREIYAAKDHSVGVAFAEVIAGADAAPGAAPAVSGEEREGGVAVRVLRRLATCLNEADWDTLHTLFEAEDYRWIDRRSAGFFDEEGRAELDAAAAIRSMSTVPKGASWTFELLADGGDVAAGRMSSRGTGRKAGPWEVVAGIVCVCRGEVPVLCEALEDDRAVILARFEELRGVAKPAVARRRRYVELHAQRNYAGLEQLYAPDYLLADTRQIGWEPWDRDTLMANLRSAIDIGRDYAVTVRTLAADDGIIADIDTIAGTSEEGAQWAATFGVIEIGHTAAAYSEIWDPDDEAGMLARFEELRSLASTADAGCSPEVVYARLTRAYNSRDWTALRELLAEDVVADDTRQVGWEEIRGADAMIEFFRSTIRSTSEGVYGIDRVLARDPRTIALASTHIARVAGSGAEFAIPLGQVARVDEAGRLERVWFYDHGDEAGMLTRFAELTGGPGRAVSDAGESPAASRWRAYFEAVERRDYEAMAENVAADYLLVDTRQMGWEPSGRDEIVANTRSFAELDPDFRLAHDVVADAGGAYAMVLGISGTTQEDAAFEMAVGVVDLGGEIAFYNEFWDPDDREAMIARVRELRPLAATASGGTAPEVTYARMTRAYDTRAWEGVQALLAPDVIVEDRRSMGWEPMRGHEAVLEFFRSTVEPGPDIVYRVDEVLARSDQAIALTTTHSAHAADSGAPFDIPLGQVALVDEQGRLTHVEFFDHSDRKGMLARFAELTEEAGEPTPTALTTQYEAMIAAFNARDWEEFERYLAADFRWTDHRPGLRVETGDRTEFVAAMQTLVGGGDVRWTYTPLETGDRAQMVRAVYGGTFRGGPFEVVLLDVGALGPGDQFVSADLFLEEAVDAARRCLHERTAGALTRYEELAGEGRSGARLLARTWEEAFNARDWERARSLLEPDYATDDRRPLGIGFVEGIEDGVTTVRRIVEAAPETRLSLTPLDVRESAGLFACVVEGPLAEGGEFRTEVLLVILVGPAGGMRRRIVFDIDQRDDAEAELRANAEPPATEIESVLMAENPDWIAAQRWHDAFATAFNARDFDAIAALHQPDAVQHDHRKGISAGSLDVEAFLQALRQAAELVPDSRVEARLMAVDGPRSQSTIEYTGAFGDGDSGKMQLTFHSVGELRDGLLASSATYDTEEEARAAFAAGASRADEAQAAFRASGASPVAHMYAVVERAFNECRWDDYTEVLRDDYRWVDFRPGLRAETHTREEFVAHLREMREGKDLRWQQTSLEERAGGIVGLARVLQTGTYRGGPYEIPYVVINAMDADGRSYFAEMFADDDPEAFRRLDELAAVHGSPAAEVLRAWEVAVQEANRDALAAQLAPDFSYEDRRAGLRQDHAGGRDGLVAFWQDVHANTDRLRIRCQIVGGDGDRRIVARVTLSGTMRDQASGTAVAAEIVWGDLREVDEEGRVVASVIVDDGDNDALLALLDEDPDRVRHLRHAAALERAYNERDLEAVRVLLHPDFSVRDHRQGLANDVVGRDAYLATLGEIFDMTEDVRQEQNVLAMAGDRRVTLSTWSGRAVASGGETEVIFYTVIGMVGDVAVSNEMYASEEEARASFAAGAASRDASASIVAGYDAMCAAFNERAWDRFPALMTPDFSTTDHRPGLQHEIAGTEAYVAMLRQMGEGKDLRWTHEPLTVHEDWLMLTRAAYRGSYRGGAYENAFLVVAIRGADGRAESGAIFAEDREEQARAHFDELRSASAS